MWGACKQAPTISSGRQPNNGKVLVWTHSHLDKHDTISFPSDTYRNILVRLFLSTSWRQGDNFLIVLHHIGLALGTNVSAISYLARQRSIIIHTVVLKSSPLLAQAHFHTGLFYESLKFIWATSHGLSHFHIRRIARSYSDLSTRLLSALMADFLSKPNAEETPPDRWRRRRSISQILLV